MLELELGSYRYPGYARPALREIELRLADGEVVGLVGANESGKSSLCLVASGLAPASIGGALDGRLVIDGQVMTGRPMHEVVERVTIGFQDPVSQRSGVAATVFEEVALGPLNLGLDVPETVARTREALSRLGIEALAERDPSRLSGGQGQLVALASLLAMRARHICLDEPTAQLDPRGAALVAGALRVLAAAGTSLLIAEHRTELLAAVCDRVVALKEGTIALEGRAADVLEDRRLPELGVAPPPSIRLARRLTERGLDPTLATG